MNSFVSIPAIHIQSGKLAAAMLDVVERIKGCATLIDALANDNGFHVDLKDSDAIAAKLISRRLAEYADCWRVCAKNVNSPWAKIDQTDLDAAAAKYAKAGLPGGCGVPNEVGSILEIHAAYLNPCLHMFSKIAHNYSEIPHSEDPSAGATHSACWFIEGELERLIIDIDDLEAEVYEAWHAIERQGRQGGAA